MIYDELFNDLYRSLKKVKKYVPDGIRTFSPAYLKNQDRIMNDMKYIDNGYNPDFNREEFDYVEFETVETLLESLINILHSKDITPEFPIGDFRTCYWDICRIERLLDKRFREIIKHLKDKIELLFRQMGENVEGFKIEIP